MPPRKHHYVWRYYLEAWGNRDGRVYAARNGSVLGLVNPAKIMARRDLYRLTGLTQEDVQFLELWLQPIDPHLRHINRELGKMFLKLSVVSEYARENEDAFREEEKRQIDALVVAAEEEIMAAVESEAQSALQNLRAQNTAFLEADEDAIKFFHFLGHQFFRTYKMRSVVAAILGSMGKSHLSNLICHWSGRNFGASLFLERDELEFLFLDNPTDLPFITGDQPVFNLAGKMDAPPKRLALYYPLSPFLALIVAADGIKPKVTTVTTELVSDLNAFTAWASEEFLVANDGDVLRRLCDTYPFERPHNLSGLELN